MMIIENNLIPQTWIFTTIPNLICCDGIVSDGDWVESKDQDPKGMVRLIQLADIGDGKYLNKSARFLTLEKAKELNCTFLNKGDILVARMPDPLGRACIFPGDEKICVTVVDVCIIRSGSRGIDHNWLMSVINSPQLRQEIMRMSSGTTRKRISKKNLSEMPIPLPPLNEQRRIVAKIEALKARSQRVKEELEDIPQLLDQFRQSVLAAAFRGDLTADWREQNSNVEPAEVLLERIRNHYKDDRRKDRQPNLPNLTTLPNIPNKWMWVTVEHLGVCDEQTVLTGPFGATLGREDFVEYGVPVITIGCLQNRGLDLNKAMYISQEKADELERYKLRAGDFLFSRMASVGRAAIVNEDLSGAIFNYHLMRLRLSTELIETKYFLYYVRGAIPVFQYVKEVNHGATRDGINTQQLSKMPVALPPLEEQHQIIKIIETYFDKIHNLEDFISDNLEKLQVCNQSILAKAFRGELVPQDPDDQPASVLLERIRAERAKLQTKTAKKSTLRLGSVTTTKTSARRTKKTQPQQEESVQLELELE